MDGIPQVHLCGVSDTHNVIVMDLLGESLDTLLAKCGNRFSPRNRFQVR